MKSKIEQLMGKSPYDVDMYAMSGFFYLENGDIRHAEKLLLKNLRYNYYSADTHYLLGELYHAKKDYVTAMEYYSIAQILHSTFLNCRHQFYSPETYDRKFNNAYDALLEQIDKHPEAASRYRAQMEDYTHAMDHAFHLFTDIILSPDSILGAEAVFPDHERRYCAFLQPLTPLSAKCISSNSLTLLRGELLEIKYRGKLFSFSPEGTALLPIASTRDDSELNISMASGESIRINQNSREHFNYYRVSEKIQISSENEFIIGEPVSLTQHSHLKKLVLSFFVDGLSWQLIREEGLENVMPATHQFFSKGLTCENYFTSSDWTYPSIASFVSGYSVPEHMMVHPKINRRLPGESKTLFACMKEAGYYTAMLNCDYRTSSTYGYTKDIHRYIAQHPAYYKAMQVIPDALEHIRAFRETNQYLWISIPDLHDIADENDLSLGTVSQIDLLKRKSGEKAINTIKQGYNPEKRTAYIQALQAIDLQFASLYQYIESHFREEEFVITMFGDHGQTYLLKPEDHHLARYHSNVAFLVRGGHCKGSSTEYMAAVDYPHILCKLAGAGNFKSPDGQLPKAFGGDSQRDYVITETIHPGDPYMAAIHAPSHTVYCTSEHTLSPQCRLARGNLQMSLTDQEGSPIDDSQLMQKYASIINDRLKYIYLYENGTEFCQARKDLDGKN